LFHPLWSNCLSLLSQKPPPSLPSGSHSLSFVLSHTQSSTSRWELYWLVLLEPHPCSRLLASTQDRPAAPPVTNPSVFWACPTKCLAGPNAERLVPPLISPSSSFPPSKLWCLRQLRIPSRVVPCLLSANVLSHAKSFLAPQPFLFLLKVDF